VNAKCFEEAKDDIMVGVARSSLASPKDKKLAAYHEGGHALVSHLTNPRLQLHKITILPRGQTLGVTSSILKDEDNNETKSQLMAALAMSMGGRAAEEIIFGENEVTTGAMSDLHHATAIAEQMISQYGMSDAIGPVFYSDRQKAQVLSDGMKLKIEDEVRQLLTERLQYAKKLLTEHRKDLDAIASALLEYETISREEMIQILEHKPLKRNPF